MTTAGSHILNILYYMFTRGSLGPSGLNNIIYDTEGTHQCRYGCRRGQVWVHMRANVGSHERTVMALESQAISAQVTKYFVTIFSKTCNIIRVCT